MYVRTVDGESIPTLVARFFRRCTCYARRTKLFPRLIDTAMRHDRRDRLGANSKTSIDVKNCTIIYYEHTYV